MKTLYQILETRGIVRGGDNWDWLAKEIASRLCSQIKDEWESGEAKNNDVYNLSEDELKFAPFWIKNVSIQITNKTDAIAMFNPTLSSVDDDRKMDVQLVFNVGVFDTRTEEEISFTFMHELAHAYDFYIDVLKTGGLKFKKSPGVHKLQNHFLLAFTDKEDDFIWMVRMFHAITYFNEFTEVNAYLYELDSYLKSKVKENNGRPFEIDLFKPFMQRYGCGLLLTYIRLKNHYIENHIGENLTRLTDIIRSGHFLEKMFNKKDDEKDDKKYLDKCLKLSLELTDRNLKKYRRLLKDYQDNFGVIFTNIEKID